MRAWVMSSLTPCLKYGWNQLNGSSSIRCPWSMSTGPAAAVAPRSLIGRMVNEDIQTSAAPTLAKNYCRSVLLRNSPNWNHGLTSARQYDTSTGWLYDHRYRRFASEKFDSTEQASEC